MSTENGKEARKYRGQVYFNDPASGKVHEFRCRRSSTWLANNQNKKELQVNLVAAKNLADAQRIHRQLLDAKKKKLQQTKLRANVKCLGQRFNGPYRGSVQERNADTKSAVVGVLAPTVIESVVVPSVSV